MNHYKEAVSLLCKQFGENEVMYLATADENGNPNLRPVNLFFDIGALYLVTNGRSEKVVEIERRPAVAVSSGTFRAWGEAGNFGSPLYMENSALRETLDGLCAVFIRRFGSLQNTNACIVKITLTNAVFVHNGSEYAVDFVREFAEKNIL